MNQIQLEVARPPGGRDAFAEGDIISAQLRAELFPDVSCQTGQVDVVIKARTEIRLFERNFHAGSSMRLPHPNNGIIPLFEYKKTINYWRYPQTPAAGRYVWPFTFEFPRHANLPYNASVEGPPRLPPSFNLNSGDKRYMGTVRVIYELEAQLYSFQGFLLRTSVMGLEFRPIGYYETPGMGLYTITKPVAVESSHLKPYSEQSKSSHFMSRMSLHKLPVSHLLVSVELPTHVSHGDPLPVFLRLDYDTAKSTATELPAVTLTSIKLRFRENVQVGPHSGVSSTNFVIQTEQPYSDYIIDFTANPVPLTERVDLRSRIPPDSLRVRALSFQNSLMRRFYDCVSVDITIECATKTFNLQFLGSHELTIHPPSAPATRLELPAPVPSPVRPTTPTHAGPWNPPAGPRMELPGSLHVPHALQHSHSVPQLVTKETQAVGPVAELPPNHHPTAFRAELPG